MTSVWALFRWLGFGNGESDRSALGRHGEDLACRFLTGRGYVIRERRVRGRLGEIDVVAEEAGAVVFVEVKARRSARFGAPFEAVDRKKQDKLVVLARSYLKRHRLEGRRARFDVVSVTLGRPGAPEDVRLIRGAFDVPDR